MNNLVLKNMAVPFRLFALIKVLQIVWSFVSAFHLMIAIIKRPKKSFQRKKRSIPPHILLDPSLGSHEYITANGIKFHYVTAGDKTKPLMLFLHGFPEFWYSWRYQLKEFSKNYHVVAVDMRGYGETEKPAGLKNYTMEILTEDVAQLIQVLSSDGKCILAAHDWGGVIAWFVAIKYPMIINRLVIMNCPHPRIFRDSIKLGWAQISKSWYMFMFQTPWLPEFILSLNDFGMFKAMYRGRKSGLKNRDNFSEEVVEVYKYIFSQKGALTPTINYHRNMFYGMNVDGPVEISTLLIWGEEDAFLDLSLVEPHNQLCSDLTIRCIPNCSHWVQQDCPDLVNQYIREFL